MAYKNSKAQAALSVVVSIGPKASAYAGTPTISITGNTTTSSTSVTALSSTTGLAVGQAISGAGIPTGATIAALSGSTLTLSAAATATASAVALTVQAFTQIGEVSSVSTSGQKWDLEDVTNFNSAQYKEFLKTLLDSGKSDLELNRVSDDAGQIALKAAFLDTAAYQFQVSLPQNVDQLTTGDSWTYAGLVTDYDDTLQIGKAIKIKASTQRTGSITYTEGS